MEIYQRNQTVFQESQGTANMWSIEELNEIKCKNKLDGQSPTYNSILTFTIA